MGKPVIAGPWLRWPTTRGRYAVRVHFAEVSGRRAWVGFEMWGQSPPYASVPLVLIERLRSSIEALAKASTDKERRTAGLQVEIDLGMIERSAPPKHKLPARSTPLRATDLRIRVEDVVQTSLVEVRSVAAGALAGPIDRRGDSDPLGELWEPYRFMAEAPDYSRSHPQYDSKHWQRVARVWRTAKSKPTMTVAAEFGVGKSTAAQWVAKCRDLGLVPPSGGRGRAFPKEES